MGAGRDAGSIRLIVAAGGGLAQPGAGPASTMSPSDERLFQRGTDAAQDGSSPHATPVAYAIAISPIQPHTTIPQRST